MIGKIGTQSTGINVAAVNRSIAHKSESTMGKKQAQKQIQAVISPMGKKQSMIQQLMKQKQYLTERMNSLSVEAGEAGINIQDRIDEFRKQMEEIDAQILKLQSQQEEKEEDSNKSGIYEKPKTKEEVEMARMNDILSLASSSDQADVISATKDQVDGRTNVLKAEIKTGNGNLEAKMEEIAELEARSKDLASQISSKLQEVNEQVEYLHEENTVEAEEQGKNVQAEKPLAGDFVEKIDKVQSGDNNQTENQ